jgi:hypothetical protein
MLPVGMAAAGCLRAALLIALFFMLALFGLSMILGGTMIQLMGQWLGGGPDGDKLRADDEQRGAPKPDARPEQNLRDWTELATAQPAWLAKFPDIHQPICK